MNDVAAFFTSYLQKVSQMLNFLSYPAIVFIDTVTEAPICIDCIVRYEEDKSQSTLKRENRNKIWFSTQLFVPLQAQSVNSKVIYYK